MVIVSRAHREISRDLQRVLDKFIASLLLLLSLRRESLPSAVQANGTSVTSLEILDLEGTQTENEMKLVLVWSLLGLLSQILGRGLRESEEREQNYRRPSPRWQLETIFGWNHSTEKVMKEKFSEAELCTMEARGLPDPKHSLRQHCQLASHQNEVAMSSRGKTRKPSLSQVVELFPQCDIGFINQGFWVETSRRKIPQCILRGTHDRAGYRSSWAGPHIPLLLPSEP